MTARPLFLLLLLAAFALVVAGCGDDDEEEAATNGTEAAFSITVPMDPQGDSSQSGTSTLTELDGNMTQVVVELFGGPDNPQPAHVHAGSCDALGAVVYPLNNLEQGRSMTQLDVALAELTTGEFAINAHQSEEQIDIYTACGDIPEE